MKPRTRAKHTSWQWTVFILVHYLASLKETPLWDKEKKQWNGEMDEKQELKDSNRYSFNQLPGVLVEAFDEDPEGFVEWFTQGGRE